MSARLLLYVSRAGASVARWERGEMRDIRPLPADAEGWSQLSDLLRSSPSLPVHVVVDAVEEHYRSEVLPRARGRDRREMTQRRLRQILHQTPYRSVLAQGPATGGKVGDRYLFMGLTAPELLQPWVEVLRLRRAPLAGIWLVPVLSQNLLARFRLLPRRASRLSLEPATPPGRQAPAGRTEPGGGDRLLLVAEQTGGLRLTYFDQGELRFSRLAPVEVGAHAEPLAGYAEQIERTRQSLLSQRLLSRGERLRVCLIDPLNTLEGLRHLLHAEDGWRCEILTRQRLLAELRLPPAFLTESSDAINLALLARTPVGGNLAPDDLRRVYVHHRLRRIIKVTGAFWLMVTLGLGLALVLDTWRLTGTADDLRASARQAHEQALQRMQGVGGPDRFEALWQAHTAWRRVTARQADPAATLARIHAIVGGHAELRLTRLRWAGPDDAQPQRLWLEGEIPAFRGDYRQAHARIEALAADLQRQGWATRVTRWPLDLTPDLEVQGDLGRGQATQAARFGLTLTADRMPATADMRSMAADARASRLARTAP